jgi:cobalt-zinc-cadmium efflux system protein
VNGVSALLFLGAARSDVNARGALLHLAADAAVSGAVIIAGAAIWLTGLSWIDPLTSLAVVAMIAWSTFGLMRAALDDALDAAPAHVDVDAVRTFLASRDGVAAVHDLHVWRPTASSTALTAHLVAPNGVADGFTSDVADALRASFGIAHATLQVEAAHTGSCPNC